MRLPDWVQLRAGTAASTVAIEAPDATLTYAELATRVGAAAAAIRDSGVLPGDRVAILGEANAAFAVAVHAVGRAGGVLVPLNARLTAGERAWQLEDCDAKLLMSEDAIASTVPRLGLDDALWATDERVDGHAVEAETPCFVIYSSGTTGRPKAVVLTHGNVYWSAVGSAENLGVGAEDRWLACMPLFHVGGLSILLRSAIYGTTAVIQQRFEPHEVARALQDEGITLLSVVPTMLSRLLDLPDFRASDLRAILVGGGAASSELLTRARARGLPVLATFGLSEAASQVTTQHLRAAPVEGSSGSPMAPTTLRVEVAGRRAEVGEVGDLLVRGPTVMAGYLGRDQETQEALRGGWLRTGDFGYLEQTDELHIVDRREDLIVSGGENVYPAEVEQALDTHPAVQECAVIGVTDAELGQLVMAVVVSSGEPPSFEELDAHVRGSLAGYKAPRRYEFTEAPLPRSALGKLLRREVRAGLEG